MSFFNHRPPLPYASGPPTIGGGGVSNFNVTNDWSRTQKGGGIPSLMSESAQWTCYKCFINNFNGRSNCFKCGTPRTSGEAMALDAKGLSMVGALACDTLLFRELPANASDASVRQAVVRYAGVEPLRVRLAVSRLFAFVQMASLADAEIAHQKFQQTFPVMDNCVVLVSFSRHSLDKVLGDGHVELLPECHSLDGGGQKGLGCSSSPVSTPFGVLPTFPAPDPSKFQFELSSSYYYDQRTGFYFDPKTEFFYCPKSKSWKFWCRKYRTYIDCEGDNMQLKRRLQEDERCHGRRGEAAPPPSEAEHRNALRNAPPPPSRTLAAAAPATGGSGVNKSEIFSPTKTSGNRRPLLLELDDDDDDGGKAQGLPMSGARAGQQDGRKKLKIGVGGSSVHGHGVRQRVLVDVQAVGGGQQEKEKVALDAAKLTPPPLQIGSFVSRMGKSSASVMLDTLSESMRLNRTVIAQLGNQHAAAKDRHQKAALHSQLEALLAHQRSLEATIADLFKSSCADAEREAAAAAVDHQSLRRRSDSVVSAGGKQQLLNVEGGGGPHGRSLERAAQPCAAPQLKRHITRELSREIELRRSPSIVELDDQDARESPPRHHTSVKPADSSSWRDKPNRDEHMLRNEQQQHHHHHRDDNKEFQGHVSREDLGQLVSEMVKRGIDEEWRNIRRRRSRTRSPSPSRRGARRDEQWRDGGRERERRSRHDERRSRSRDRSREHQQRSQDVRHSRQQQFLHGQEPMTIASTPSPPPEPHFGGDSWVPPPAGSNNRAVVHPPSFEPPHPFGHGPPPPPLGAPLLMPPAAGGGRLPPPMMMVPPMPNTLAGIQLNLGPLMGSSPLFVPRFGGGFESSTARIGAPLEPRFGLVNRTPPGMRMTTPGVPPAYMLPSSSKQFFSEPEHVQQRYPAALSSTAARMIPSMWPAAFAGAGASTPSFRPSSGTIGGTRRTPVNQLLLDNSQQQQQQKKRELANKEREKVNSLGICLNCGRHGHSLFQCRWGRISDDALQKKLREANLKLQRQELDKQELKRKAENFPLRRKDPLIERLRVAAPEGKIKMEHIRMLCPRCAHFNHKQIECSRPDIGRTLHKQICTQLEEFKKAFFVHLQEDKMVDLSQKFDTFRVMDGIELNGTIDPVGLQLHGMCPDGFVTQMDLRELCSNCAQLGHKRIDCKEKTECSRTHFDKMLTLVKGYRALVKEGSGNFLLPRTNMNPSALVLKDIERSEPIEEILLDSSSDEEEMVEEAVAPQQQTTAAATTEQKSKEKENVEGREKEAPEKQSDGAEAGDAAIAAKRAEVDVETIVLSDEVTETTPLSAAEDMNNVTTVPACKVITVSDKAAEVITVSDEVISESDKADEVITVSDKAAEVITVSDKAAEVTTVADETEGVLSAAPDEMVDNTVSTGGLSPVVVGGSDGGGTGVVVVTVPDDGTTSAAALPTVPDEAVPTTTPTATAAAAVTEEAVNNNAVPVLTEKIAEQEEKQQRENVPTPSPVVQQNHSESALLHSRDEVEEDDDDDIIMS
uniref:RanBP2-type domain-containing protein n=1 Tax=Globodera rostochiensis TaxID=31243 RepID=A0A914IE40_GLORO